MQTPIEQYLASNEEQRLTLFLIHRNFRRQFIEIEMAALKARAGQQPAAEAAPHRSGTPVFRDTCLGWVRRCWMAR